MMNKRGISVGVSENLVKIVLALVMILLGYLVIIRPAIIAGGEVAEYVWLDVGNFTPYNLSGPVTVEDKIADDSIKTLLCSINMAAHYEKMKSCFIRYMYGCDGNSPSPTDAEFKSCIASECSELPNHLVEESDIVSFDYNYKVSTVNSLCPGVSVYDPESDLELENCEGEGTKFHFGEVCFGCHEVNAGYTNGKFVCTTRGFELPQETPEIAFGALDWAFVYGDPLYVMYYEAFPAGEDESWMSDRGDFITIGFLIEGVITLLPVGGKILTGGAERRTLARITDLANDMTDARREIQSAIEIGDEAAEIAARTRLRNLNRDFSEIIQNMGDDAVQGIVQYIRASRGSGSGGLLVNGYVDEMAEEMFKAYRNLPSGSSSEEFIETFLRGKGLDPDNYNIPEISTRLEGLDAGNARHDDLINTILEGNGENAAFEEILDLTLSTATESSIMRTMKKYQFKNMVNDMLFYDDAGKLVDPKFDDVIEKVYTRVDKLSSNPELMDQAVRELDAWGSTMIDDAGDIYWEGLLGRHESGVDAALDLLDDAVEAEPSRFSFITDRLTESYQRLEGSYRAGLDWWPGQRSLTRTTRRATMLLALGHMASRIDSINQKFVPVGLNKIALKSPSMMGDNGVRYDVKDNGNYYLTLIKDTDQTPARFFLASPCKTDLVVTTGMCSCDLMHKSTVYEFTDFQGITRLQEINQMASSEDEVFYLWDEATDAQRAEWLVLTGGVQMSEFDDQGVMYPAGQAIMMEIMNDPEKFETYWNMVFPEPVMFADLASFKQWGLYEETVVELIKTENMTQEQYQEFISEVIDHVYSSKINTDDFIYSWDNLGNTYTINIPKTYMQVFRDVTMTAYGAEQHMFYDSFDSEGSMYMDRGVSPYSYKDDTSYIQCYADFDSPSCSNIIFYHSWFVEFWPESSRIYEESMRDFFNSEFFDSMARNAVFQLNIYKGDRDLAVKQCRNPLVEEIPTTDLQFNLKTTIPCVTIDADLEPYEDYNSGENFCYLGTNPTVETGAEILNWVALGVGLFFAPETGGTSFVLATVLDVGSLVISRAVEYEAAWPNHCIFNVGGVLCSN